MPQFISTNVTSIIARNNLDASSSALSTSIERLSSGQRINSSKDDAAGMAIASRMTSQIRGMQMAKRNTLDAISMTQTTEGALGTQVEQLQRIRELAVQASNGILGVEDRAKLDNEAQALMDEIDRIATSSSFNGNLLLSHKTGIDSPGNNVMAANDIFDQAGVVTLFANAGTGGGAPGGFFSVDAVANELTIDYTLLDATNIGDEYTIDLTAEIGGVPYTTTRKFQVQSTGEKDSNGDYKFQLVDSTYNNMVNFQVGADEGQRRMVEFVPTTTVDLGLIKNGVRLSLATVAGAQSAIGLSDQALRGINDERANMGAYQNRLNQTVSNLNSSIENTSASRSRIEDTDFAEETAIMTKNQILHQAGIAMLQQANSLPESVLSLLK
jgi:flagellin